MVGALQVFEALAVAAGARGRPCVDACDYGGAEHDLRCVAVLKCCCEATDVCNHAAAHDEHGFVARHAVVFELNQYLFDTRDVLAGFVAVVHQLDALDAEVFELSRQFLAVVFDDLVAYDGHDPAEGFLHVSEDRVVRLEDIVGDFDGGCECGGHNCFDGLRVLGGQGQPVAVPLDAGRHDGVRVYALQVDVVLYLLRLVGQLAVLRLHLVFEAFVRCACVLFDHLDES